MMGCLTCCESEGVYATAIIETKITNPVTRAVYSGPVCSRCFSIDRITRVRCRTFRRIEPDEMRDKADQPLDKNA